MLCRTVDRPARVEGIGLHSGRLCVAEITPAPAGAGIWFRRVDLPDKPLVEAVWGRVVATSRGTTLGDGGAVVRTVEHLMAALHAAQITDCIVNVDGVEIPILDGSSAPILAAICASGVTESTHRVRRVGLSSAVVVADGEDSIAAFPSDRLVATAVVSYPGTPVGTQLYTFDEATGSLSRDVCPARTLGFTWEADQLRQAGLALGGSMECAVVADADHYLTELRFAEEVARHKVLDLIGDLRLLGVPCMRVVSIRGSHRLNDALRRRIQELDLMIPV